MKNKILVVVFLLITLGIGIFIGLNIRKNDSIEKVKIIEMDNNEEIYPSKIMDEPENPPMDKVITDSAVKEEKETGKDSEVNEIIKETLFNGSSKLAILIDDTGSSLALAKDFRDLNMPLSFAILPYLAKSREVNKLLSESGYKVLLHLPMEGSDKAVNENTKNLIKTTLTKEEIYDIFNKALENVGPVSGFNNHMGSVFTSSEEGMGTVLEFAKNRGLFYIDSKTTSKSKGYRMAKNMEIPSAECMHFIDNSKAVVDIEKELKRAVEIAHKKGRAVVIGHFHKNMVEALKNSQEMLAKSNVKLVFVDEILE